MLALDAPSPRPRRPRRRAQGQPAHAYLLHGPAGAGKREVAREFAGELLARGAKDPENVKTRAEHGSHPDLTWVTPSGAHEMLRRDVDEAVVAAAAHTPFEATAPDLRARARGRDERRGRQRAAQDARGAALLRRADPADGPADAGAADDRQPLPGGAVRPAGDPGSSRSDCNRRASRPTTAEAAARLSLGDANKALALALGDGPALAPAAESLARAPLKGTTGTERPWKAVLDRARLRGQQAKEEVEAALVEELQYLPKKEHKRRETEFTERARRADRRAATQALDHALQLTGLWYRDLTCVAAGVPELAFHSDRADALEEDAGRDEKALRRAMELVDDTRARLILNVSEELACEALAYRLEETLS